MPNPLRVRLVIAKKAYLFDAPVDGFETLALEVFVGLAEVLAAEEPAVGRKRARVRGRKYQVATVGGDERLLFDGETAPEQEYKVLAHFGEALDDGVGKLLPADAGVACRHVGTDRERCVQEQDSLVRPAFEVPVRGRRNAQVVVEFLEYVDERRGRLDTHGHREAQAVRLAGIVVGILPDDDRLDLVHGAVVECGENLGTRRVHNVMLRFLLQELVFNLFEIRLLELVGEQMEPRFFEFYCHSLSLLRNEPVSF